PAFERFSQQRGGGVLVENSSFYLQSREQLVALADRHALPAIYAFREYALAGGLMSYGSSIGYFYHQLGSCPVRVRGSDRPADLPVQQLPKLDLVTHLKTARALGLSSPERVLATGGEVI